jgi:hypothetical protein
LIGLVAAALLVLASTLIEIGLPGRPIYHTGWYNVALVALAIVILIAVRRAFRRTTSWRSRIGLLAIAAGSGIAALAGAASGLLAPDNQTIVGAPGERIAVEALGTILFPK